MKTKFYVCNTKEEVERYEHLFNAMKITDYELEDKTEDKELNCWFYKVNTDKFNHSFIEQFQNCILLWEE